MQFKIRYGVSWSVGNPHEYTFKSLDAAKRATTKYANKHPTIDFIHIRTEDGMDVMRDRVEPYGNWRRWGQS